MFSVEVTKDENDIYPLSALDKLTLDERLQPWWMMEEELRYGEAGVDDCLAPLSTVHNSIILSHRPACPFIISPIKL